jgi:cytochrome c biogenesis protein CcmG, thiol:disulfide interchange protein DsbE
MTLLATTVAARLLPLALLLLVGAAPVPKQPKLEQLAPEFEVKLTDGTKLKLSDMRGQVVVLNFWATWCVPCRTELPTLNGFYAVTKERGLRVIAVTTEGSVPLYRLKPLFQKLAITPAVGIKGPYAPLGAVPTNFVIGRDGRVRYAKSGALDLAALNRILIPLLQEPAPPPV